MEQTTTKTIDELIIETHRTSKELNKVIKDVKQSVDDLNATVVGMQKDIRKLSDKEEMQTVTISKERGLKQWLKKQLLSQN